MPARKRKYDDEWCDNMPVKKRKYDYERRDNMLPNNPIVKHKRYINHEFVKQLKKYNSTDFILAIDSPEGNTERILKYHNINNCIFVCNQFKNTDENHICQDLSIYLNEYNGYPYTGIFLDSINNPKNARKLLKTILNKRLITNGVIGITVCWRGTLLKFRRANKHFESIFSNNSYNYQKIKINNRSRINPKNYHIPDNCTYNGGINRHNLQNSAGPVSTYFYYIELKNDN